MLCFQWKPEKLAPPVPSLCCLSLFPLISLPLSCTFPLPQAKVDNEILNYKDLAALPKVKSIYEVQRPDLISYEPHSRYTSDEMLERCGYGEVGRLAPLSGAVEGEVAHGVPSRSVTDRHVGLHSAGPWTLINWNL